MIRFIVGILKKLIKNSSGVTSIEFAIYGPFILLSSVTLLHYMLKLFIYIGMQAAWETYLTEPQILSINTTQAGEYLKSLVIKRTLGLAQNVSVVLIRANVAGPYTPPYFKIINSSYPALEYLPASNYTPDTNLAQSKSSNSITYAKTNYSESSENINEPYLKLEEDLYKATWVPENPGNTSGEEANTLGGSPGTKTLNLRVPCYTADYGEVTFNVTAYVNIFGIKLKWNPENITAGSLNPQNVTYWQNFVQYFNSTIPALPENELLDIYYLEQQTKRCISQIGNVLQSSGSQIEDTFNNYTVAKAESLLSTLMSQFDSNDNNVSRGVARRPTSITLENLSNGNKLSTCKNSSLVPTTLGDGLIYYTGAMPSSCMDTNQNSMSAFTRIPCTDSSGNIKTIDARLYFDNTSSALDIEKRDELNVDQLSCLSNFLGVFNTYRNSILTANNNTTPVLNFLNALNNPLIKFSIKLTMSDNSIPNSVRNYCYTPEGTLTYSWIFPSNCN